MAQQFLSSLEPLTRHPLLPHAEKFRVFGRKKKMCHQLKRFALIPEDLRRLRDWRLGQTRDHTALLDRHRTRGCDYALIFSTEDHPTNLRLEIGFVLHELPLQMISRKFERHELVMIMCVTRCRKRVIRNSIIAGITRKIIAPRLTLRSYRSAAVEI